MLCWALWVIVGPCYLVWYGFLSKFSSHSRKYNIKFTAPRFIIMANSLCNRRTFCWYKSIQTLVNERFCRRLLSRLVPLSCNTGSLLDPSLSTTIAALLRSLELACKQALLFGQTKWASRKRANEGPSRFSRLASLAQIGELARRLAWNGLNFPFSACFS